MLQFAYFWEVNLKKLRLYHFKNHTDIELQFANKVNAIIGKNGVGKTNVLDAVFLLANTKSYFNHLDSQLIQFGEIESSVMGTYLEGNSDCDIQITFGNSRKKIVKKNGKAFSRIIDYIGQFGAVFITPYDISLVFEGSEERRKFIDFTISQLNKDYLQNLIELRKTLEQRNIFLKSMDGRELDPILLESYDYKLIPLSEKIHLERVKFISEFNPFFHKYYQTLCGNSTNEKIELQYLSPLNSESMKEVLLKNHRLDLISGRTNSGVHKDDIQLEINGLVLKKFGSQGQIKSAVIALKLAQYQYIKEKSGHLPILLLDDIFEKIDENRSQNLMEMVCSDDFGQIFVSDTHANRVKDHFDKQGIDVNYHMLDSAIDSEIK